MSIAKKELRRDDAQIELMQEPLMVRVEKLRGAAGHGTQRTPIDLPPRDGEPPGMGWDKDSVRRLETWLVKEWSGGGFYHVTITDAVGKKHEWQFIFDPREYPEKTPPTMLGSEIAPNINTQAPKVQAGTTTQPSMGIWPPPGFAFNPNLAAPIVNQSGFMAQAPMQAMQPMMVPMGYNTPQIQHVQPFPSWAPPPPTTQAPTPPTPPATPPASRLSMLQQEEFSRRRLRSDDDDQEKKQLEARARELEAKIHEAERHQLEQKYKADLEKNQSEARAQMEALRQQQQAHIDALKEEFRRMTDRKEAAPNPELEAIRKEREELQRQRERDEINTKFKEQQQLLMDSQKSMFEALQALSRSFETRQQQAPAGPDPAVVAMMERQKALEDELRRERERAENDRRERDREERLRLELQRRDDETKRLEADARRREELLNQQLLEIKNSANRGPDPMFLMMKEISQAQTDAMKDIVRAQQDSSNKMSQFMLSPRDILAIQKENSSGIDDLKRNVVDVYRDVFDLQREVVAQAAQLQPQGESTSSRIMEETLKRVAGLADRYLQGQRDTAVSAAKVQEAAVQAQSAQAAMKLQAEHAFRQRQAELALLAQREQEMLRSAAAEKLSGFPLNGASTADIPQASPQAAQPEAELTPPRGVPKKKKKAAESQIKPRTIDEGVAVDSQTGQTIAKVIPLRRLGHTDEEWFGPALDHVAKLRSGVEKFMQSLAKGEIDPKTQMPYGTNPMECVDFLVRAVNYIVAKNMPVRAFQELFLQGQFADLMDILLPDAPQQYRDDCVQLLLEVKKENEKQQANEVAVPTVSDVSEQNDDDDDDDDDEHPINYSIAPEEEEE